MSRMHYFVFAATVLLTAICFADNQRQGYVLRIGEGEPTAVPDAIIKASPKSGTQGGVVIRQGLAHGGSTGLHYHIEADEFFYVAAGEGQVTIGDQEYSISAGDFIFVPAGEDHKLNTDSAELIIIVFLDKPGLDEEMRTLMEGEPTLEKLNEIGRKYGTVYKTVE